MQWPRGDTPSPKPKARGDRWEELPHTPMPEAKGGGQEDQPHIQEAVAAWVQEGLEELSHIEGSKGGGEEIPLVQGKEQ